MNLISRDGIPFRSESPTEITRLLSRGYTVEGEPATTFHDELFHPGDHKVDEVQAYLADLVVAGDVHRVIAEEKAGQARVSIVGKPEGDDSEPV